RLERRDRLEQRPLAGRAVDVREPRHRVVAASLQVLVGVRERPSRAQPLLDPGAVATGRVGTDARQYVPVPGDVLCPGVDRGELLELLDVAHRPAPAVSAAGAASAVSPLAGSPNQVRMASDRCSVPRCAVPTQATCPSGRTSNATASSSGDGSALTTSTLSAHPAASARSSPPADRSSRTPRAPCRILATSTTPVEVLRVSSGTRAPRRGCPRVAARRRPYRIG